MRLSNYKKSNFEMLSVISIERNSEIKRNNLSDCYKESKCKSL
jgi:hypothetical protein